MVAEVALLSPFRVILVSFAKPFWFNIGADSTGTHNSPDDTADQAEEEDDMMYDCDAGLGVPSAINCSQLDYSQLGASSDTVTIAPGTSKILSSSEILTHEYTWLMCSLLTPVDDCSLAVSSSIPLSVTWGQIRWALEMLIYTCVMNPSISPVGGRAYYKGSNLASRDITTRNSSRELIFSFFEGATFDPRRHLC